MTNQKDMVNVNNNLIPVQAAEAILNQMMTVLGLLGRGITTRLDHDGLECIQLMIRQGGRYTHISFSMSGCTDRQH